MRNLLLLLAAVILLASCGDRQVIDPMFRWPAGNCGEVDSLLVIFEKMRRESAPRDSLDKVVRRMARVTSGTDTDPIALSRAMYCRARLSLINHNAEEAATLRNTALVMLDSATSPYDFYRWKILGCDSASGNNYRLQTEAISFFRSVGDLREAAQRSNSVGCMMFDIGYMSRALEHFERAREMFYEAGDSLYAAREFMNIALVSPPERTDSILRELLDNRLMKANESSYLHVLVNYYTATDSVVYLERATDICRRNPVDSAEYLPVFYAYLGDNYCRNGNETLGFEMLSKGLEMMPPNYPANFKAQIYGGLAGAYMRMGRYRESAEAAMLRDSLLRIVDDDVRRSALINADMRSEVESMELDWRMARNRMSLTYTVCLSGIIIGALIVILILFRRSKQRHIDALRAELRLKESEHSELATSTVLEEKSKLIDELSHQLNRLNSDAGSEDSGVDDMLRMIHRHNLTEEERECFLRAKNITGASWVARLRKTYPLLTERQVKIASWIAAGADSAQIARILNIDRLSVNKARYRLRSRLNLPRGSDLDKFLRDFGMNS